MLVMMAMTILVLMLQGFLSMKESKWLGVILPVLCLAGSIISTAGTISFETVKEQTITEITESSEVAEEVADNMGNNNLSNSPAIYSEALIVFAVSNIPTLLLLVIYIGCRKKLRIAAELEKMAIQDLE